MFITHQPQHHSDEQPQPDFRQAIRNAPINSFNPSVKALMKEFVFLTFAETLEAFRQLDPLNKVKYFHLYRQAVCADEDPRENNGEWMPNNNMYDNDYLNEIRNLRVKQEEQQLKQQIQAAKEEEKAFKLALELEGWKKEYYEAGIDLKNIINSNLHLQFIRNDHGPGFFDKLDDLLHKHTLELLQKKGIKLPAPVRIDGHDVKPDDFNNDITDSPDSDSPDSPSPSPDTPSPSLNPSTLDDTDPSTPSDSDNPPSLKPSTLDTPQLAPQPVTETSPSPSPA